jgi:hypothetical protein
MRKIVLIILMILFVAAPVRGIYEIGMGTAEITLQWTAPNGTPTSYILQVTTDGGNTWNVVDGNIPQPAIAVKVINHYGDEVLKVYVV